jgi:hypothetical protein
MSPTITTAILAPGENRFLVKPGYLGQCLGGFTMTIFGIGGVLAAPTMFLFRDAAQKAVPLAVAGGGAGMTILGIMEMKKGTARIEAAPEEG